MPTKSSPYQPLLLRLLHGATGIATILAIITAYWTYDTYDGRLIQFLPKFPEIEGIHGTLGLCSLLLLPLFVLYACHRGARRLIAPDSLGKLRHLDKPIGWYSLHRVVNTVSLIALTLAVVSGKMMDEKWLPKGELDHPWYYVHVASWVILLLCVAAHVLVNVRVGGMSLLLSVWRWQYRAQDSPAKWLAQIKTWWRGFGVTLGQEWGKLSIRLQILEVTIMVSVVLAWLFSIG